MDKNHFKFGVVVSVIGVDSAEFTSLMLKFQVELISADIETCDWNVLIPDKEFSCFRII